MNLQTKNLLPCPFCGAPADVVHDTRTGFHGMGIVRCLNTDCRAQTRNSYISEFIWNSRVSNFPTAAAADDAAKKTEGEGKS